jgi:hypothetical protein
LIAEFPENFPSPPELEPLCPAFALPLVSFIIHDGDPNYLPMIILGENASVWTPYSQGELQFKFTAQGSEMLGSDDLGRCAFWRSIGNIVPY